MFMMDDDTLLLFAPFVFREKAENPTNNEQLDNLSLYFSLYPSKTIHGYPTVEHRQQS